MNKPAEKMGRPAFLGPNRVMGQKGNGAKFDCIVEAIQVDTEKKEVICRLPGQEKTFRVKVRDEQASRPATKAAWEGNQVDARMVAEISPIEKDGKKIYTKLILEDALIYDAAGMGSSLAERHAALIKYFNEKDRTVPVNWIHKGPHGAAEEKLREGIVTLRGGKKDKDSEKEVVYSITVWDDKAIDATDAKAVAALMERVKTQNAPRAEGAAFRNAVKIVVRAVKDGQIVGAERILDYMSTEQRMFNVEEAQGYVAYMQENYPSARIEILTGTPYFPTAKGPVEGLCENKKGGDKTAAHNRARNIYRAALHDKEHAGEEYSEHLAVPAAILFSPGKVDARTGSRDSDKNIVNMCLVNGRCAALLESIPGVDGQPLKLSDRYFFPRKDAKADSKESAESTAAAVDPNDPFAGLGASDESSSPQAA